MSSKTTIMLEKETLKKLQDAVPRSKTYSEYIEELMNFREQHKNHE